MLTTKIVSLIKGFASPLFTPAIPFRLETLGYGQISSLTGWLSAAYAAGLIIATFPFVWLGARSRSKRNLLLAALLLMAVGVIILMVVPNYAAMVAGRVLQGASGAGIWTLGLALGMSKPFTRLIHRSMTLAEAARWGTLGPMQGQGQSIDSYNV